MSWNDIWLVNFLNYLWYFYLFSLHFRSQRHASWVGFPRTNKWRRFGLGFKCRHIDDFILLKISKFGDYICRSHLSHWTKKIMYTTYTVMHALTNTYKFAVRLRIKLYYKKRWFDFLIVNFRFICCNITAVPTQYREYISQLKG